MRKIELDELKQLQLQILDEVASFCNQHNIKYFLMAGTLLGAVRHQGYIPWDDDIDIGMLREDYEKFIELYQEKGSGLYYLYSHRLNKNSTFPFIKICLKNTKVVEEFLDSEDDYGINIDLFPIDSISSTNAHFCVKKINFFLKLRYYKVANLETYSKNKDKLFLLRVLMKFFCSVISYSFIFDKINVLLEKERIHPSIYKGNIIWGYGVRELSNPNIFDEVTDVVFEGKLYKAPKKYDEWLTNIYGDYMTLPSLDKQVSHHIMNAYVL